MQLVVMGTGPFAVPMFQSLARSDHQLAALVTRPDGSRKPAPNPMRDAAVGLRIPVLEPEDINQPLPRLQLEELRPDLLVVCDYGQILSAETLQVAPLGGINLHGSLLPRYRGAAPVQGAIIQGESTTGVSVIHMTPCSMPDPAWSSGRPRSAARKTPGNWNLDWPCWEWIR